jgi:hypothetical protein
MNRNINNHSLELYNGLEIIMFGRATFFKCQKCQVLIYFISDNYNQLYWYDSKIILGTPLNEDSISCEEEMIKRLLE